MYDLEEDLRAVRLALGNARSNAPELPSKSANPVNAIPDLVTAVEQLNTAVEKIAKYLMDGRGGGGNTYSL